MAESALEQEAPGLLQLQFTLSLPDWWPPESLNRRRAVHFGKGHAWEGSYDWAEESNLAEVEFHEAFRDKGLKTLSTHPMGKWASFRVDSAHLAELPDIISARTAEIAEMLAKHQVRGKKEAAKHRRRQAAEDKRDEEACRKENLQREKERKTSGTT